MYRLLSLLFLTSFALLVDNVHSECTMTDDVCEFWLEVSDTLTMMHEEGAVYSYNNTIYRYDVTMDEIKAGTAKPIDPDSVLITDGWEINRIIVVINGSMPGPPIEVYEDQTVIVHVKNLLKSDGVTVHWHGMHQPGSPWMDGVAFVTQCPINPGATFTYRFKANPKGTFWYHSHIGSQLGMGLVGALIIHEKKPLELEEHIVMLQDWNHDWDSEVVRLKMNYGSFVNRTKLPGAKSLEGASFSMFQFQSGLINGRGRYFGNTDHYTAQTPLTVYPVVKGKSYRFRVIGAGVLYPFRVSIDNHMLKMVASDGFEFEPMIMESFIINPGERFDFIIAADQPVDNYYLRAETLEIDVKNHIGLAVIRYDGAKKVDPIQRPKPCAVDNRCVVLNCPFMYYPKDQYTDCISFDAMRSTIKDEAPGYNEDTEVEEIFINWAFPGTTFTPASANGIQFQFPVAPPLTQPNEHSTMCGVNDCKDQEVCQCSTSIPLEHGKIYQFNFLNLGVGKGWAHPIHMHGHSFWVVKMGYPSYDLDTGKILKDNPDIDCRGGVSPSESYCNHPTWSDSSWNARNLPGQELEKAPRKDTIMVPTGGFAVVRIKADNPGAWIMHCHIELHSTDGMAVVLNESFDHQPPPPHRFPTCGDYNIMANMDPVNPPPIALKEVAQYSEDDDENHVDNTALFTVVGAMVCVIIIQLCVNIYLYNRRSLAKMREYRIVNFHDNENMEH